MKYNLKGLVKFADADRNRMVHANRVRVGLESPPQPMIDAVGRRYEPGMRVKGQGSNRAFFTPEEISRIGADHSKFIHEHPGQYAAALATPYLAGAVGAAAPIVVSQLPLAAHVAGGLGAAGVRTWWQGGDNPIRAEEPIVRGAGHLFRATTNLAPLVAFAQHRYGLTKRKMQGIASQAKDELRTLVDKARSRLSSVSE